MTDKEQIIINGVVYYKQQDINKGLDEEHYITEFHLLATHYNLLLEDYARKAQEYNELLEQYKELDDRVNRMIEEKYNLATECEYSRKALKDIEGICLEDTHTFADGKQVRYDTLDDILYIINELEESK